MARDVDIRMLSHYKLLCSVGEKFIFYSKGNLYSGNKDAENIRFLVSLPGPIIIKALSKVRLLERLARLEPRLALGLNNNEFLLSYQGKVIRINLQGEMVVEHHYRQSMNNPLSFCVIDDCVLYGEYFGNLNHEEVSIYKRLSNGEWLKNYTFPAGSIQHIHQICFDEYRHCFWILTGDKDCESAIWQSDINFNEVKAIFCGSQKYRSCFIMPSINGISYSTDTPLEENWIFTSKQRADGSWSDPVGVYKMPGPCIYGKRVDDGNYIMATSVEPDASLPTPRYYFTNRLGKGVLDRYTHILYFNSNGTCREIAKFGKDRHKLWLFQFGNMLFPKIENETRIICTGQSLRKLDGRSIEIIIDNRQ